MNSQRILVTLALGAFACAGPATFAQSNSKPTVLSPPAIKDGSNWSRAPFPSQRQFDDVKSPDGQAVDQLPPNTPATNVEPPPPPARVAIFQSAPSPTVVGDPGLLPTGRPTIAVASTLETATFAPTIRVATHASRDQIVTDIESRVKASESAMSSMRSSASQMSADGRQAFDTAATDVKDKAKALRKSINAAKKASASEWENARAQLAADYDAYAAALARVDATAGLAPAR